MNEFKTYGYVITTLLLSCSRFTSIVKVSTYKQTQPNKKRIYSTNYIHENLLAGKKTL